MAVVQMADANKLRMETVSGVVRKLNIPIKLKTIIKRPPSVCFIILDGTFHINTHRHIVIDDPKSLCSLSITNQSLDLRNPPINRSK